jgi:hypothetical protein
MFTITSYSAFRTTTRPTFAQAVEIAETFAREGDLPATISAYLRHTDQTMRWTKWAGAEVELQEGNPRWAALVQDPFVPFDDL